MDMESSLVEVGDYVISLNSSRVHGDFGTVYKAENKVSQAYVAAKSLALTKGTSEVGIDEMVKDELDSMIGASSHENLMQIYDYFRLDDLYWIFFEYGDLGNLKEYLIEYPDLEMKLRIKIMFEAASAIVFIHNRDHPNTHLNIQLENIMMKREGNTDIVKLTDVGLATLYKKHQPMTRSISFGDVQDAARKLSKYFQAPELFAELGDCFESNSVAADTFALGLVYVVVLDGGSDTDFLPLSVEARQSRMTISIGEEMMAHHRGQQPCPTIVRPAEGDSLTVRRVKRIIANMTKFEPVKRKDLEEVESEMSEIFDYLTLTETNGSLQNEKDELFNRTQQLQRELSEKEEKECGLITMVGSLQHRNNKLETTISKKNETIANLEQKLSDMFNQLTLYKDALDKRHKLDDGIKQMLNDQSKYESNLTSTLAYYQTNSSHLLMPFGNRQVSKFRKIQNFTEKDKDKYLKEVGKLLDKTTKTESESEIEALPDILQDQCEYMQSNPDHQLHAFYGNDAPFHVPPWFHKHPRQYADAKKFVTELKKPHIENVAYDLTPMRDAETYFRESIARPVTSVFVTQLKQNELAWSELPVGVVSRGVCAPNQDPNYNDRPALSSEKMNTKRMYIARRLAENHKKLMVFEHVEMRHGLSCFEDYRNKVNRWVESMQQGWLEFMDVVRNADNHN